MNKYEKDTIKVATIFLEGYMTMMAQATGYESEGLKENIRQLKEVIDEN